MSAPALRSGREDVAALDRIMYAIRNLTHNQIVRVLRFVVDSEGIEPSQLG